MPLVAPAGDSGRQERGFPSPWEDLQLPNNTEGRTFSAGKWDFGGGFLFAPARVAEARLREEHPPDHLLPISLPAS